MMPIPFPTPTANPTIKSNMAEVAPTAVMIFDLKTPYNHNIRGIVELLKDIGQKNRKGKLNRAGKMGPSMRSTR